MREVYTEPKVAVVVEENDIHDGFYDIIIKNIGLGPAYNITFLVREGCVVDGVTLAGIRRLSVLNNGISYLGPNQSIKSNVSYIHDNESFFDTSFHVATTYKSRTGKQYFDEYAMQFSEFEGITAVFDTPIEDIRKNIKKIADSIESLSDGRKEIRTIMQTTENKEKTIKDKILSNRGYLKK
jgi:hypothetical protein